jgi:hypothetical protein
MYSKSNLPMLVIDICLQNLAKCERWLIDGIDGEALL